MVRTKFELRLRLDSFKCSTCYTKFELRLRLVLIKCLGMVRTKFNLRLRLDFIKCSTQKTGVGQLPDPNLINDH